jgi:hypothetical protein
MTYAPFGSSGSDDYFDRHKFNELKKRHDSTANDPRARAAFKKEFESKAAAATKKPTAKPTKAKQYHLKANQFLLKEKVVSVMLKQVPATSSKR